MNKEAIIAAAKELGRVVLFAAITAAIGWFTQLVTTLDPGSTYYIVGTVLLRLVDKYVHANPNINAQGVAPF